MHAFLLMMWAYLPIGYGILLENKFSFFFKNNMVREEIYDTLGDALNLVFA